MTCWELTIIHFSADQTCGDAPYQGIYILLAIYQYRYI